MIKSSAIFVATIFFSFAQNYDPNTGELIKKEVYDPLTGELKKENKAQIKKKAIYTWYKTDYSYTKRIKICVYFIQYLFINKFQELS